MSKRSKYSAKEKYEIIKALERGFSIAAIAHKYGINKKTFYEWDTNIKNMVLSCSQQGL